MLPVGFWEDPVMNISVSSATSESDFISKLVAALFSNGKSGFYKSIYSNNYYCAGQVIFNAGRITVSMYKIGNFNDFYVISTDANGTITATKQYKTVPDYSEITLVASDMTLPTGVELYGSSYNKIEKYGRVCVCTVSLKISNLTGQQTITNYIKNTAYRPKMIIAANGQTGDADGKNQPFTLNTNGSLVFYPVKTGVTYCQGTVSWIAD